MNTMIIVTTRPSTEVKFYKSPEDFLAHRESAYINTGKIEAININFSDDKLVKTVEITFSSEANMNEYYNDRVVKTEKTLSRIYNLQHNITAVRQKQAV